MLYTSKTKGEVTEKDLAGEFSKFVTLGDVEVHYEFAKGKKADTLVVLLHGFGANTFSYRKIINEFTNYGDVVSYDRPCFGLTVRPKSWSGQNPYSFPAQVKLLDAVIEHFGSGKKVILVGHSAGAGIAAEWAVDHEDRLRGLILEEPAILNTPPTRGVIGGLFRSRLLNRLGPRLVAGFKDTGLKILYKSWFDKSGITEEVLHYYTLPLKVIGWEAAFWEFTRQGVNSTIQDRLGDFKLPVLVFVADHDEIVSRTQIRKVAELIPNSTLVEITNCGHIPHEEKPKEFLQAVSDFLSQR
ncbi:MAG: hypothetical protein RLZZ556_706 [Actinomycetota bacterium]